VVPQRKANISPRIGGRVAKIFVQDGTVVKEGQVIAVLEDADYRASSRKRRRRSRQPRRARSGQRWDLLDAQRQYDREQILQRPERLHRLRTGHRFCALGGTKAGLLAAEATWRLRGPAWRWRA